MSPQEKDEGVLYTRIYKTDEITAKGVSERLVADVHERRAIANALDLLSLDSMRFEFRLHRSGRTRFKLNAHLLAVATQSCVVTLETIESIVDERLEIEFWPPEEVGILEAKAEEEGMEVPLEGPEPIIKGQIDIGQLAYEHLAAGLESYPRKPGACFDWQDPQADPASQARDKPFAELARLKRSKDASSE